MNIYTKGIQDNVHSLDQVFKNYQVSCETEFVKRIAESQPELLIDIAASCGTFENEPTSIEIIDKIILERKVRIGKSMDKRADLLFEHEGDIYYFEFMSQSGGGNWDDEHQSQLHLKRSKLQTEYPNQNIYTFAVAYKEYDSVYLNEIQNMVDTFAIYLKFTSRGYFIEIYGQEEKIKESKTTKIERNRTKSIMVENLSTNLSQHTSLKIFTRAKIADAKDGYLGVYQLPSDEVDGIYFRIELKPKNRMSIKLGKALYQCSPYSEIIQDPDTITQKLRDSFPHLNFVTNSYGGNDTDRNYRFMFDYDITNQSVENLQLLESIVERFKEIFQIA